MVKIINGYKEYKGKVNSIALKNINISFAENGLSVICGVSGSGKTTLLNCIAGLDKLTSGEIVGCEKEDIGFIFQDFALIDNLSIYDNLKIAYDMSNQELSIEEALVNVNINEPLDKKVNELSGGQKQRIAIARALLISSKIIIADEPTGNLDKENSINIAKILKDISKEKLVIVVTHDKSLFEDYADRIIMLDDGMVVSDYVKNDIKENSFLSSENKRKLKLNIYTILKIFLSGFKNNFSKLFIGIFILFLAMFSIMIMLNTISISKNDMLLNAMSEYNVNILNFSKKNEVIYETLEKEDLKRIDTLYQDYILSYTSDYQCDIDGNNVTINRIYETNIVKEELLIGKKELDENKIIVSHSLGKVIQNFYGKSSIEDVIGINILVNNYELCVSGITEKVKALPKRENTGYFESLFERDVYYVYMNSDTLGSFLYADIKNYSLFNTKYVMNNKIYDFTTLTNLEISEGNNVLNDGEIVISNKDFKYFFGEEINKEELLNKVYDFEFYFDNQKTKSHSLKIIGFANYTAVNSDTFKELFKYSTEYYDLTRNLGVGIFRKDLSKKLINQLEKINIVTDFCLYENIESAYSTTNFIGLSMIIVIIPIILILVLFLISYSKQNILLKRKEIGILKSLGLSNKEISKIFIFDSLLLLFIASVLTLIFTPIGIDLLNDLLISTVAMFYPIVYNPIFIIVFVLVIILILILSLSINLLKLNKKSDVDLVYGR